MKDWLNKALKYGAVATLVAVPSGVAVYETTTPDNTQPFFPQTAIVGQDHAEVGELVRLKAHGEDVEWKILPEVSDYQVFGGNNENMVVSFRNRGDYTVIAAIITPEVELEIETLKIEVGASDTVDPVAPVDPVSPVVPVNPPVDADVALKVAGWSADARLPKDTALEAAEAFEVVAEEVDAGQIATPEGVVARTGNLLSQLPLGKHQTLLENLMQLLTDEADSGRLVTQPDHSYLWRSIARGFRDYASMELSEPLTATLAIAVR